MNILIILQPVCGFTKWITRGPWATSLTWKTFPNNEWIWAKLWLLKHNFKRRYIPPLKRSDSSFEQTCGPLTQRCVMHSLIISFPVIPEKKILISRQYIFTFFALLSPFGKWRSSSFGKLYPKMLCATSVWTQWFWKRRFSNVSALSLFPHYMYLPLKRVVALHMIKFESPCTQGW